MIKHVEIEVHTHNYVLSPHELVNELTAEEIPFTSPFVDAKYPKPKVISDDEGSTDQFPTISIVRKKLGELTVLPEATTAGALEDFEIDYKVTRAMESDDIIEIRLPRGWAAPTFATPHNKKPADVTDETPSYAFLSGSGAAAAGLDVIDDLGASIASVASSVDSAEIAKEAGWIVEIELEQCC